MKKEYIDSLLHDDWYIQAGNLTPLYLISAAISGFEMKRELMWGYSAFLFDSKQETGSIYYRVSDLERLHKEFFAVFEQDNQYFIRSKLKYEHSLEPVHAFYQELAATDLAALSLPELLKQVRRGIDSVTAAVGFAHMTEPISIPSDTHLKKELGASISDEHELQEAFVELSAPKEESNAERAAQNLRRISKLSLAEQKREVEGYMKEYSWMWMSCAGPLPMSADDVFKEMHSLGPVKEKVDTAAKRKALIDRFRIPDALLRKFGALSFMTHWQDERKRNILIAVEHVEHLLEELSKRVLIPLAHLRYALKDDFTSDLEQKGAELSLRRDGSLYIANESENTILTGAEYERGVKVLQGEDPEQKEVRGMGASKGTATGAVRICMTLEAIAQVKDGEILVASMTRPEYYPAMRKAAAFVTDEGGITCHAAIVAREMGKPCIIGTKNATRVLKDGSLVEVDANLGLVTILRACS